MLHKKILTLLLTLTLFNTFLMSETKITDLNTLDGDWHLRVMDGKEVRKARAILDFQAKAMQLEGFDGCNKISGKILRTTGDRFFTKSLKTTRMACRQNIHRYVSQRVHQTMKEGFSIVEEKRYGVKGITIKSASHNLFFKRMGE